MDHLHPQQQDRDENYNKLLTGAVVGGLGQHAVIRWRGLAPFSSLAIVCNDPPMVSIGIEARPADGQLKDTARNLLASSHCVVHVANQSLLDALHATSADWPPGASELDRCGLAAVPSLRVTPHRVAQAPVECMLVQALPLGRASSMLAILRVVYAHVRKSVMLNGRIDAAALNPVCRVGGPYYGELGTLHHRARL